LDDRNLEVKGEEVFEKTGLDRKPRRKQETQFEPGR
jgi:hypothetical protein